LRLSEADDLEARYPPQFGRIVIWADTVEVLGWIRLHGRQLQIHARRIVARPVNGRPPVIDVSGAPASDFDPQAPSKRPKGTAKAPDGRAGQDGDAGQDGGRIEIVVDEVDGALGLAANGSRGGHSERGSDGAQPLKVHGVDAKFKAGKWPTRGPHGGGVLQKRGLQKYVAWAAGQPGGNARDGGAAGAPGRPGDGGQGGQISLQYSGAQRPALATIANGGDAGTAGAPARPGKAGAAGVGGRNRIYYYEWFKGHNEFARSGQDKTIDKLARQYKVTARAQSGRGGARDGAVPAAPAAAAGVAGEVTVIPVDMTGVAAGFDLTFLQLVLSLAQQDAAAGRDAIARQRHQWLVRVTAPMTDPAAATIGQAAAAALEPAAGPTKAAPAVKRSRGARTARRSR
jgi:hypothetical protein